MLNSSFADLQLRGADQKVHLLRPEGERYREVTSQKDWPSYHGSPNGNRYTTIDQFNKDERQKAGSEVGFQSAEHFAFGDDAGGGGRNDVCVERERMLRARCREPGGQVWHFFRDRTKNLNGNAGGGFNRGVAIAGDRLFMVMDHAHIVALNRFTGEVLWDTEMADWKQNYNATSAPLVVGDLVISGIAGGDEGVRGFVAAFDQSTGKEAWRFWTVPQKGEPLSETWKGTGIDHPSAATWFTGSYDAQLGLVYWQAGNPGPDYNGDDRQGDNLYSDSTLALDAKTGN